MTAKSNPQPRVLLGRRNEGGGGGSIVEVQGSGSIITFAPVASEKDEDLILPNLERNPSSIVIIDPDGVRFRATADARRAMGQRVVRLDPFRHIDEQTDAIDPMDAIEWPEQHKVAAQLALTNLLFPRTSCRNEAELSAQALFNAVLSYRAGVPEKRSLDAVVQMFWDDDIVYNLAVVLDTIGGKLAKEVYAEIAAFLQLPDAARSNIMQVVRNRLAVLQSLGSHAQQSMSPASPPLVDILTGGPFTIYIVVPRERLRSHAVLPRLVVGTLLQALAQRSIENRGEVLFLLDECQELERFSEFEAAVTLRWPEGVLLWSFWNSPAALRAAHPDQWTAMIENGLALQTLGPMGFAMGAEIEALFNLNAGAAGDIARHEQMVLIGRDRMALRPLSG